MTTTIYLVTAHRQTKSSHTYPVGIFSTPYLALEAATAEEDYRGGKYGCTIQTLTLDAAAPDPVEGWPVIRQPPTVAAPAPPEPASTPARSIYPCRRTLYVVRSSPAWTRPRLAASLAHLRTRTGMAVTYADGILSAEPASVTHWLAFCAEVDAIEEEP